MRLICWPVWPVSHIRYGGRREDLWGSEDAYGPGTAHRMSVDEIRVQQQQIIEGSSVQTLSSL